MHRSMVSGALAIALLVAGCDDDGSPTVSQTPAPPTPTPGLSTEVVPADRTGPTEITFLAAEPPPGSTLTECGSSVTGCSGRVQMRFRLLSASGGTVLDATAFLHGTNLLACFAGSTGPLELAPAVPTEVVITFDQPDEAACAIPATIASMKVVLSATVEVAALQEWAVQYEFLP